ncbi:MAG: hypothetical protein HQK67_02740, partial [Desulfamplus sp.]|nr:hypothetical protein [Desulfamplus sp.]
MPEMKNLDNLTTPKVRNPHNTKISDLENPNSLENPNNIDNIKANFKKKYFIAGSTHPGEEEIILSVFKELKESQRLKLLSEDNDIKEYNDIKLIIAPRDPERATSIREILYSKKYEFTDDIIIIDKMGILAGLYSICDIAFVGGSLLPFGGH